jgi:hypothetical protein
MESVSVRVSGALGSIVVDIAKECFTAPLALSASTKVGAGPGAARTERSAGNGETVVFRFESYAAALSAALVLGTLLTTPPAPAAADNGASTPVDRSSPTPAPLPDKAGARALALAQALQQGTLERGDLTASLNAQLGDDALAGYRTALAGFGKPLRVGLRGRYREETATSYVYRIYYATATADLAFAIDDGTGKISVLFLRGGPPPPQ